CRYSPGGRQPARQREDPAGRRQAARDHEGRPVPQAVLRRRSSATPDRLITPATFSSQAPGLPGAFFSPLPLRESITLTVPSPLAGEGHGEGGSDRFHLRITLSPIARPTMYHHNVPSRPCTTSGHQKFAKSCGGPPGAGGEIHVSGTTARLTGKSRARNI